jgi:polyphenol oxidase
MKDNGGNMDLSNENMVHVKKDGIEYLQFKRLLEFKNLVHAYTLSVDGIDFNGKAEKSITEHSYDMLCDALEINRENVVKPHQTHTDCIKNVDNNYQKTSKEYLENVDGLLTCKPDTDLVLSFADCTPILLYDPVKNVIGNIHSGWRGTAQKIGQKAVQKMISDYGSKPEDIIACIGPCIGKCHFEVDEDVKNIFEQAFSYLNRNCDIIEKRENKYHIDTTLINRLMLEECGLQSTNIIESKICTVCNSNVIHSYRAQKDRAGRNIAVLGMTFEK